MTLINSKFYIWSGGERGWIEKHNSQNLKGNSKSKSLIHNSMTIAKLNSILSVLSSCGFDDEYICAEHDTVYLLDPGKTEEIPKKVLVELEDLGCHVCGEGLACFV